jgi:CrcB protein
MTHGLQLGILMLVAAGCAAGGVTRHLLQHLGGYIWPGYAAGTIAANLAGSFIAGLILSRLNGLTPETRAFLLTGFLGGLTTMSSFALDMVVFFDARRFSFAAIYWLTGAMGCVLACMAGVRCSRFFIP